MNISDADGHKVTVKLEKGDAIALEPSLVEGDYDIVITGKNAPAGKYFAKIEATDSYGLSTSDIFKYELIENQAPVKVKDFANVFTDEIGKKIVYNVGDYISDTTRSEERRVGKESRSRWSPYH